MEVKNILKKRRIELHMTLEDVAQKAGVSAATISRWESGDIANMRRDRIVSLARALQISPAVIMGWSGPPEEQGRGPKIPLFARISAGSPPKAIPDNRGYEEITQQMVAAGDFFALRVSGPSMEPTLREGDIVIVKKESHVKSGDLAVVLADGGDAAIREIQKFPGGIIVSGHNAAVCSPRFYSKKEIKKLPVRIIGRVVESRRKF